MDRRVKTAIWALAGVALAVSLSLTAFAVAGGRLSEPAGRIRVAPSAAADRSAPGSTKPAKPGRSKHGSAAPAATPDAQPASSSASGGTGDSGGTARSNPTPGSSPSGSGGAGGSGGSDEHPPPHGDD